MESSQAEGSMSNTVPGGCRYYHPGVHCPLEGLWRLTQDCIGEEEEGAPACPLLSFLAPFHVFSMHTLSFYICRLCTFLLVLGKP